MQIKTSVSSPIYDSYRAARVRSIFNVSDAQGSKHDIDINLPIDDWDWKIGVVVGPSGSGKTTLGRQLFGGNRLHYGFEWHPDKPIIDEIGEGEKFDKVTGALTSVGLGTVPSWLRPFHVLSMGEKFRAEMARILIDKPEEIVIDEFTSVVDRQVAQVGAYAFAKAWRKTQGKAVLLSCHYDIIDWLTPDWILDTKYWEFDRDCLRQRPKIKLDIYETSSSKSWSFFKNHHYLDLPMPVAPNYYIGEINGTPVAHLCVATLAGLKTARLTRLVVAPEWQGCGVGIIFLETIAQLWLEGKNRYNKKMTSIIHTSHPGLAIVLSRSKKWVTVAQKMGGGDKLKAITSLKKSAKNGKISCSGSGYGGHLRGVNAFRYVGER